MQRSAPLIRQLAQSPVCRGLDDAELQAFFALAEERSVPADTVLFKEGQLSDSLLVVVLGKVQVTKRGQVLAMIEPGGVLGELSLFKDSHLRLASATAFTPVRFLRIPSPAFKRMLDLGNVAALKVVNNLAHQMAERILSLNEQLLSATSKKGVAAVQTELRRMTT